MNIHRRLMLKHMAFCGAAGFAMGNPARALAAALPAPDTAHRQLLALVNEGAAGSAFSQGAAMAGGRWLAVRQIGPDLGFMLGLDHRLRSGRPMRVIGLLDDASGTLTMDLARSAGARVHWLGRHTAHAGVMRHHLSDAAIIGGRADGLLASGMPTAAWACAMGHRLAVAGRQATAVPGNAPAMAVPDGSFVSFSIETQEARS
jgi:hypothetical protein